MRKTNKVVAAGAVKHNAVILLLSPFAVVVVVGRATQLWHDSCLIRGTQKHKHG